MAGTPRRQTRKPKRGRHTKRTPETADALVRAIGRYGLTDKAACAYAGLDTDTLYRWINADPEFAARIAAARAKFKAHRVRGILSAAARGEWKADAWMLSHRFPDEYAERRQIVSTTTSSPLDRLFGPPPPDNPALSVYDDGIPADETVKRQTDDDDGTDDSPNA